MYLKIYNITSFSGHYFLILMFRLFDHFVFQTLILMQSGVNKYSQSGKWDFMYLQQQSVKRQDKDVK